MAPPKDVTEAIVEYKNAAEDWDIKYESYQEAVKDVKRVPKALQRHLKGTFEKVEQCFKLVKKFESDVKTNQPEVDTGWKKINREFSITLMKSKTPSEGSSSEEESKESEEFMLVNNKVAKLDAFEEMINTAETKLQKLYNDYPDPTNISVSLANKAYEDLKTAESKASDVYVELQVLVNKNVEFAAQKTLVDQSD